MNRNLFLKLQAQKNSENMIYAINEKNSYQRSYDEIYKNIGIKYQYNTNLVFYQYNFNYIDNATYIKYNNNLIPLYIDISGNYYCSTFYNFPEIISIVILYNIESLKVLLFNLSVIRWLTLL